MVGQVGLEPTMVKPADLQSAAIAARRLKPMVEPAGIEPATLKFQSGAQPSAKSRFAVASGMLAAARIPTELCPHIWRSAQNSNLIPKFQYDPRSPRSPDLPGSRSIL